MIGRLYVWAKAQINYLLLAPGLSPGLVDRESKGLQPN
jgi:hypothetical protein